MDEEVLLDKLIKLTEENVLLKMEIKLKNKFEKSNIKLNDDDIDALFNPDNFRFGDKPKTKLERLQNMISDDFWGDDKSEERKVGVRNETRFRK